jgi:hypothetical protein
MYKWHFFPLDKLTQNPYDVVVWHLFFSLPQSCVSSTPRGKATRHREMQIQLKHFLIGNWENLQEEFSLQAQALATNSNSMHFPQHDPSTHKCL